jgi:CheY-like chemotaxis protein
LVRIDRKPFSMLRTPSMSFARGVDLEVVPHPCLTELAGPEDLATSSASLTAGMTMSPYRILVVDDNPFLLEAVESLLATSDGIEVVATVSSGHEALARTPILEPDLVLMDLSMPGMDGTEATRLLASMPRPPRVVIMTAHDDDAYRAAAEKAGADGFLYKSDLATSLLPLVRALLSGREGRDNEKAAPE